MTIRASSFLVAALLALARPGTYLLKAVASPVPGEIDLSNNNQTLVVDLPSHSNMNSATIAFFSAFYMAIVGFAGVTVGVVLSRRRLR